MLSIVLLLSHKENDKKKNSKNFGTIIFS